MKNRLHDKKAGIAILVILIIVSVAEVIFRHVFLRDMISTTANYAETLAVLVLALTVLCFTLKGKDRLCYIIYGAWIAYFVFDQLFELPSMIITMCSLIPQSSGIEIIKVVALFIRVIGMSGIIFIGIILAEYMNDGTVYNRLFNIITFITFFLLTVDTIGSAFYTYITGAHIKTLLAMFNNLYRLVMLFLFTFFAYDSAKKQLSKVDFSSES
ncbi:MAG: hypothetical protein U0K92_00455 [Treponema sp.]|nr:hypothetical protein [Treponema sp.]